MKKYSYEVTEAAQLSKGVIIEAENFSSDKSVESMLYVIEYTQEEGVLLGSIDYEDILKPDITLSEDVITARLRAKVLGFTFKNVKIHADAVEVLDDYVGFSPEKMGDLADMYEEEDDYTYPEDI